MARTQDSPILAQLRSARTLPDRIAALRALKNEVVGHAQLKEAWVGLGVLEPIVRTIASSSSQSWTNGKDTKLSGFKSLADEDAAKLQALQLVASFANGGPAFLDPMHAANIVPAILTNIAPDENPPQIVVAALRALSDIVDAAGLAPRTCPLDRTTLADLVFVQEHIESLTALLALPSSRYLCQTQVSLAAGLIGRLCQDDRHRQALTMAGALDALSSRLASFALAQGHVVPGAEALAHNDGMVKAFPEPAQSTAKMEPILFAIARILGESKYRAHRLVFSPSILAVFPSLKFRPTKAVQDLRLGNEYSGSASALDDSTAMEYILPVLPISSPRTSSPTYYTYSSPERIDPQLSRSTPSRFSASTMWDSPRTQQLGRGKDDDAQDVETPLIPWLIYLVRNREDNERLSAASILTSLFKAGLGTQPSQQSSLNQADEVERRHILQRAPAVLAHLISDSETLQKAAFDCDAVGILTRALKRAYSPVDSQSASAMWSPYPDTNMDVEDASAVARMGQPGEDPLLVHHLELRESSLMAIAALAGQEEHRKALVREGFIPYVVESLAEYPKRPQAPKDKPSDRQSLAVTENVDPGFGRNTLGVIIAACHVTRMLSRSVSILRTALVDHAVALPILKFMEHPDIGVKTAATATMCNLVLEVSPVRELLTELGVMSVLCDFAHSDNHGLRINAFWALKHFVDAVGPDLKRKCLEELGASWLVQLVWENGRDTALYSPRGERSLSDTMDEVEESQDQSHCWVCPIDGAMQELDASNITRLRQAEDKLAAVRETELDPARQARNNDIAIQEQGLDLIRNLIGRPGSGAGNGDSPSETTEMIDYLLAQIGEERLFSILASKLRSRMVGRFTQRGASGGQEARMVHPHAKIMETVIYILVHIAASIPRHRQLVIDQTDLLKALCQQATNKDPGVRVALCHLVSNLTCQDDEGETPACQQRAQELRKLGFLSKMETMRHHDRDIDVRERAKTAAWQLEQAC
ncbi:armadillo repeat protein [Sarocladium implicatum]|nr:armadillo repeat protein [Sarocladium implicatum]